MTIATPRSARKLDPASVILNALTFGLLIAGVNGIGEAHGSSAPAVELVAAALVGAVFVRRQLRVAAPLLPLDLLRRPVFALSLATSISSFAARSLALVALPFFFEDTLRRSETATSPRRTAGRPVRSRPPRQRRPRGDGSGARPRRH